MFGNLLLKDLCRKYNSLLHKTITITVGLRQALAGRISNKKKKKKSCESARKKLRRPKTSHESEQHKRHNEMLEIADGGVSQVENDH
jgi:hypothetical protein